jgi:hypothetical protein
MRTVASMALALMLIWSTPVRGQSVSEMGARAAETVEIDVDPQIVNASRALEEAVKGYATGGETVRGGSGTIASLLVESDKLICNSWMIGFNRAMTELATGGALNTDAGTAVVQALNRLRSRIEEACEKALNTRRGTGVVGGGEGGVTPMVICEECEPLRAKYEEARSRHAMAEFRLLRANADANMIIDMFNANPFAAARIFTTTPSAAQDRVQKHIEEWKVTKQAMDDAYTAWLKCVEECHRRNRQQFGFFDNSRNKILVAAAAVGVATVALIGGGTPTALAQTPAPAPVGSTTPDQAPVVNTPPPPVVRTLLSLLLGNWICDACRVLSDPAGHERNLRFCIQLIAVFQMLANSPMRIEHPEPWITPTGELEETSGAYRGTGMGRLGSFSGVSSTVVGTFQRTGDTVSAVDLTVTLGENGVFPGGRPVSYVVRLRKTP